MERERYTNNGADQGMMNDGLFGPDAVETAAFVEPLIRTSRRVIRLK